MIFPNNLRMEFLILDHRALKEMKLSKSMEFPWRKSQMMRFNLLWEQFARIWSSAHEVIPQGIMKWLKCEIMVCSISHLASLKIIYFPTWHSCKAKLFLVGFSRRTRSENSKSIFSWCQFFQKTSNKIYLGLPWGYSKNILLYYISSH